MKILQVHNETLWRGGGEEVVDSLIALLKRRGHEVKFLGRSNRELRKGFRVKAQAFFSGIYSLPSYRNIRRLINRDSIDVVHVHNIFPWFSPSILVACRRAGIPTLLTCHDYRLVCPTCLHLRDGQICELCAGGREYWCVLKNCRANMLESVGYALRSVFARKLRLFHENVTLFIALTMFAKNKLVEAGFPEERIVVMPNMAYTPDSGINASKGEYVAYAGRFSREKGIETLLSAAYQAEIPICLAGDYSPMQEMVKGAPPNIKFLGRLDPKRMREFYRNSRFLVLPSIWFEVCPMVILEAMSHGLPVIASRLGGLAEIVEDGITGFLFEPGNTEDLATKMKLLWEDRGMCRRMGQAGWEKAKREYSEDVYYERVLAAYKKAISLDSTK